MPFKKLNLVPIKWAILKKELWNLSKSWIIIRLREPDIPSEDGTEMPWTLYMRIIKIKILSDLTSTKRLELNSFINGVVLSLIRREIMVWEWMVSTFLGGGLMVKRPALSEGTFATGGICAFAGRDNTNTFLSWWTKSKNLIPEKLLSCGWASARNNHSKKGAKIWLI
jgi:hypothetical protein